MSGASWRSLGRGSRTGFGPPCKPNELGPVLVEKFNLAALQKPIDRLDNIISGKIRLSDEIASGITPSRNAWSTIVSGELASCCCGVDLFKETYLKN